MTLPNFIIIGAQKAGTTSLFQYLKQHPQVYMSPIKEPQFFALDGARLDFRGPYLKSVNIIKNIEAYKSLFHGVSDEKAIGEGSTWYLYSQRAPERIRSNIPDVKLIAMLRHPADRAYSNFLHCIRLGIEPLIDFEQALRDEETRLSSRWGHPWYYTRKGFYYSQLKRYFQKFDVDQIRVYLYEDFKANPTLIIHDISRFLEIDQTFVPDVSVKHNESPPIIKSSTLHNFLNKPNLAKSIIAPFLTKGVRQLLVTNLNNINLVRPQLSNDVRRKLIKLYREDILKLQDLVQRDLSKWLDLEGEYDA